MWPFSSKKSIEEAGLLQGATDWHCHLLPGVDDGVKTLPKTLELLTEYERLGYSDVWFTPHIMEDVPNTPASLRQRFQEVKESYQGPLRLHLAAENMMDNLFEERLEQGDLLPLGETGNHLLVETSYFSPPTDMDSILRRIMAKGYFPMLAHPERYVYMDRDDYKRLKEMGVKFQLNIFSLVGAYGETARKKGEDLLAKGWYSLYGSDTHRMTMMRNATALKALSPKTLERLRNNPSLLTSL